MTARRLAWIIVLSAGISLVGCDKPSKQNESDESRSSKESEAEGAQSSRSADENDAGRDQSTAKVLDQLPESGQPEEAPSLREIQGVEALLGAVCGEDNVEGNSCGSCPTWMEAEPREEGRLSVTPLLPVESPGDGSTSVAVVRLEGCRVAPDHYTSAIALRSKGEDEGWDRVGAGPFDSTETCQWIPASGGNTATFVCRSTDAGWAAMFSTPRHAVVTGTIEEGEFEIRRPLIFAPNFSVFRQVADESSGSCPPLEVRHGELLELRAVEKEGQPYVFAKVAAVRVAGESGPDETICEALRSGWQLPDTEQMVLQLPVANGDVDVAEQFAASPDKERSAFGDAPDKPLQPPADASSQ